VQLGNRFAPVPSVENRLPIQRKALAAALVFLRLVLLRGQYAKTERSAARNPVENTDTTSKSNSNAATHWFRMTTAIVETKMHSH
jgi:hypothetical protein